MVDQEKLRGLIARLKRQRGPYMGDGINAGFTTIEVLEFLEPLQDQVDQKSDFAHNNDTAKDAVTPT